MADIFPLKKPVSEAIQEFVADASLQIDIGDLLYHDTNDAKPASSQADGGTEAINQRTFAKNFAGVANSSRQSTDATAGTVRVQVDGLYEFPCASSAFEIGDMVGASENGDGDGLLDQQVEKVTDKDLAIGVVVKRYGSATTRVWCRLQSRVAGDLGSKLKPAAALTAQLTTITPADAEGTPDYAIQAVVNSNAYGFVTAQEAITTLYVIKNLQTRLAEVEAALEKAGIVVAN